MDTTTIRVLARACCEAAFVGLTVVLIIAIGRATEAAVRKILKSK